MKQKSSEMNSLELAGTNLCNLGREIVLDLRERLSLQVLQSPGQTKLQVNPIRTKGYNY